MRTVIVCFLHESTVVLGDKEEIHLFWHPTWFYVGFSFVLYCIYICSSHDLIISSTLIWRCLTVISVQVAFIQQKLKITASLGCCMSLEMHHYTKILCSSLTTLRPYIVSNLQPPTFQALHTSAHCCNAYTAFHQLSNSDACLQSEKQISTCIPKGTYHTKLCIMLSQDPACLKIQIQQALRLSW